MSHKLFKLLILFVSVTNLIAADVAHRPTHNYLEQFPIEEIIENYHANGDKRNEVREMLPFFFDIIEKENEIPVFAYHASTENFRIYQDILKATFEEVLGYDLPEDFYFFRIPGGKTYDFENGRDTFFNRTLDSTFNYESKQLLVHFFILNKIRSLGLKIDISDLEPQEVEDLADPLKEIPLLFYLYQQRTIQLSKGSAQERNFAYSPTDPQENVKHFIAIMEQGRLLSKDLTDAMEFASAVEKQTTIWQKVLKRHGVAIEDEMVAEVIRETIEPNKLLDNIIQFFLQGSAHLTDTSENLNDYYRTFEVLVSFVWSFQNTGDMQAKIISLNMPLFGNYEHSSSNTSALFLENETTLGGDSNLSRHLESFFEEIGVDPLLVDELISIAKNKLREHQSRHGVLFQFYSLDDESYHIIDTNGYVALAGGTPIEKIMPSKILSGEHPVRHHNGDFQLRLIMSNQHTLNPYSQIRMKRYDDMGQDNSNALVNELKAALRTIQVDELKRALFQEKIGQKWGLLPSKRSAFSDKAGFPQNATDGIKIVTELDGSTGPLLVEYQDQLFVKKTGNHPDHIVTEYYTNKAYKALGVPVPEVRLYDDAIMLSEYLEGQELYRIMYNPLIPQGTKEAIRNSLKRHFVADVLLANWDVCGAFYNNIIVDKEGTPIRIDNGSGFQYRAQGGLKEGGFSDDPIEIETMRDQKKNPILHSIFHDITNEEIAEQLVEINKNFDGLLDAVPKKYHAPLRKRLDTLNSAYIAQPQAA